MHQLGRLALAERDVVEAEDVLGRALELVAGQHRPSEALVASDLAVLNANLGRKEEARAALRQSRSAFAAQQDWRGLAGRLDLASAALAASEGRNDVADRHFKEAVTVFRRYRLPWDEAQALECWGTTLIKLPIPTPPSGGSMPPRLSTVAIGWDGNGWNGWLTSAPTRDSVRPQAHDSGAMRHCRKGKWRCCAWLR